MGVSKPGGGKPRRATATGAPLVEPARAIVTMAMLLSLACNVSATSTDTGGTQLQPSACGRGIVVVHSDYQSTNVSLLGLDGSVLSPSFVSSASASTELSTPLSGDILVPTMPQEGEHLVLLDRYPAAVLTWMDVEMGTPQAQLSIATGFHANPHDYVRISDAKAYVTRFESNPSPGAEPFDGGNDVLILSPSSHVITGRIDMAPAMQGEDPALLPRADRMVLVGDRLYVLLGGYDRTFVSSAPSRLVSIDVNTDMIDDVLLLEGLHGCAGLALAPAGDEIAVVCSGNFGGDSVSTLGESGVVFVLADGGKMTERRRFPAAKFGAGPVGMAIDYLRDTMVLLTTFGRFAAEGEAALDDTAVVLDTDRGTFEQVMRSDGVPFTLGDVRCAPACGVCFLADAQREGGVVHRFEILEGGLGAPTPIVVERTIGLPPRNLGRF